MGAGDGSLCEGRVFKGWGIMGVYVRGVSLKDGGSWEGVSLKDGGSWESM